MATLLGPATGLLNRMSYAWKILVLALVMVLPLVIVADAYIAAQRAQIAFTQLERDGTRYLGPLLNVALRAVDARDRAANGTDAGGPGVDDAVRALDPVDASLGAELGVSDAWRDVKTALSNAASAAPGTPALAAWNTAMDGILAL